MNCGDCLFRIETVDERFVICARGMRVHRSTDAPCKQFVPTALAPPPSPGDPPSPGGYPDKAVDAVAFNRQAEERFRLLLDRCEGWLVSQVVAEASFILDVSPETARRYIQKYTAPSAPWQVASGRLTRRKL